MIKIRREPELSPAESHENLQLKIQEAITLCNIWQVDVAVFKNHLNFHFCRELKFCEPAIDTKFVALAKFRRKT